jgi:hypothetical protein
MHNELYFYPAPVLSAFIAAAVFAAAGAGAAEARLGLMSSGAVEKLGGYMPQRVTLSSTKPEGLKKVPGDLAAPLFGEFKLGPGEAPTRYFVVVDEPEGKPARLYVDTSGSGELSEASAAEWKPRTSETTEGKKLTMYSGGATFKLALAGETLALHVPMYRFDKNDPQRAALTNNLLGKTGHARFLGNVVWSLPGGVAKSHESVQKVPRTRVRGAWGEPRQNECAGQGNGIYEGERYAMGANLRR